MRSTAGRGTGLMIPGIIAILAMAGAAHGLVVEFPDANLEAAIRAALNQPTGPILETSVLRLESLNASFRDITDLQGLEYCTNLTQLQLQGNQIEDITALGSLIKLTNLYLSNNLVSDISPLAGLVSLQFLFLQNNRIVDVTPLKDNSDNGGLGAGDIVNLTGNPVNQAGLCGVIGSVLRPAGVTVYVDYACGTVVVYIPDTNLNTLLHRAIAHEQEVQHKPALKPGDPVRDTDMEILEEFTATDAQMPIVDLTGLEWGINIDRLDLTGNRIKDVSPLAQLGKLVELDLGGNQIADLSPLQQLYKLSHLEVQNQHDDAGLKVLSTVHGLKFLAGLTDLYLHENAITDISDLAWLLNLERLTLSGNPVSDIRVLDAMEKLVSLDLGDMGKPENPERPDDRGLTSADLGSISRLINLNHLGLWKNKLTSINSLKGLTKLTYLDVSHNKWVSDTGIVEGVSDIGILSGLSQLGAVYLDYNLIADTTPLAGLRELSVLGLRNNIICDITPLVANHGLAAGDMVDLRENPLSQESLRNEVPELIARNVAVRVDMPLCEDSKGLTIEKIGKGKIEPFLGVRRFCPGTEVTLIATPEPAAPGEPVWEFNRWEGDLTGNKTPAVRVVDADIRIVAVFVNTNKKFTLTTSVNNPAAGVVSPAGTTEYASGTRVTIKATARAGYVFDYWSGDLPNTAPNPVDMVITQDRTVQAVFKVKPAPYTLTMVVENGRGGVTEPSGTSEVTPGSPVSIRAIADSGWVFDHWEWGTEPNVMRVESNPYLLGLNGDLTVRAVFNKTYVLTMHVKSGEPVGEEAAAGTTIPPVGSNVLVAGDVVIRAVADFRSVFDRWEGSFTGADNPAVLPLTANKSVTAIFRLDRYNYTLTVGIDGEGATDPPPGMTRYARGTKAVLQGIPAPGWVFDHWSGDVVSEDTPVTVTMDKHKTVRAVFLAAPVTYTLTTSVVGGGTVSPPAGTRAYADGKKVTLVATPDLGWAFDHWEGDAGGSANITFVTMSPSDAGNPATGNKTVTAVFRKLAAATGISPDKGYVSGGEVVTVLGLQLATAFSVAFGEQEGELLSVSDTSVSVRTPAGGNPLGVVEVVVHTAAGTTTVPGGFTFIPLPGPPELGMVMPTKGSIEGGNVVLIRGRNLALAQTVSFGGTPALIASSEDTRLYVATLPHEPGTVDIAVTTTTGSASLKDAFTYVIKPRLVAVYPNQGTVAGGERVQIFGIGLANPSTVTFGNVGAAITSSTDVSIEVVTPPNPPGPVDVTVTGSGGAGTLTNAFDYFDGAATLSVTVLAEASQTPVLDATLRLEPLGHTVTQNDNGVYAFTNVRPGSYILAVSAPSFAIGLKSLTLQRDELASITMLLRPIVGSASACGPALKRLDAKVAETTVPLSVQESPTSTVSPMGTLAIRLTADDAIDPATVWAALESSGGWVASGGAWRAVVVGDDKDGWVTFTSPAPMPRGETVTMTAGAVTVGGAIVGPVSYDFRVAADDAAEGAPALKEEPGVASLASMLASASSAVYRITPSAVFASPVTIQIPAPSGLSPEEVDIYYYSESSAHAGWYRGGNVSGWIAPDTRRAVDVDGKTYIEVQVNHGGVVQLGQAVKVALGNVASVELGASGSGLRWISLGSVLVALSLALGTVASRRRSH